MTLRLRDQDMRTPAIMSKDSLNIAKLFLRNRVQIILLLRTQEHFVPAKNSLLDPERRTNARTT
ncbi:MAG: hypothetical protein A3K76_02255 [Euryarchaeota archaeon RBG_13_57_23]|nr:MAG: hypothetical protein A3K76_02255 [Euryarchaeota archaeon RBG_13_57_23]